VSALAAQHHSALSFSGISKSTSDNNGNGIGTSHESGRSGEEHTLRASVEAAVGRGDNFAAAIATFADAELPTAAAAAIVAAAAAAATVAPNAAAAVATSAAKNTVTAAAAAAAATAAAAPPAPAAAAVAAAATTTAHVATGTSAGGANDAGARAAGFGACATQAGGQTAALAAQTAGLLFPALTPPPTLEELPRLRWSVAETAQAGGNPSPSQPAEWRARTLGERTLWALSDLLDTGKSDTGDGTASPGLSQLLPDSPRLYGRIPDSPGLSQVLPDSPGLSQLLPDSPGLSQLLPDWVGSDPAHLRALVPELMLAHATAALERVLDEETLARARAPFRAAPAVDRSLRAVLLLLSGRDASVVLAAHWMELRALLEPVWFIPAVIGLAPAQRYSATLPQGGGAPHELAPTIGLDAHLLEAEMAAAEAKQNSSSSSTAAVAALGAGGSGGGSAAMAAMAAGRARRATHEKNESSPAKGSAARPSFAPFAAPSSVPGASDTAATAGENAQQAASDALRDPGEPWRLALALLRAVDAEELVVRASVAERLLFEWAYCALMVRAAVWPADFAAEGEAEGAVAGIL